MSKSIIAEGKTSTEAIEKGLKELNVSKDMVDVKVLEESEKRSFYSILTPRVVKVELTVKENIEETKNLIKDKKRINPDKEEIEEAKVNLEKFLKEFLKEDLSFDVNIEECDIVIKINGENVGYLIGNRGESITALQIILCAIANKKSKSKISVFLDIAGYREKRKKTLEELAEKIEKTVVKTGKAVTLEPMVAFERKIIHTKLQNSNKIKTFSKGEEPYRKVVITLK